MSSRTPRIWQKGIQNYVFLPDFWVAITSTPVVGRYKLPRNCVKFEVDPRMTKHDVKEYLTKIYDLPVREVRTEVQMGDITWSTPKDFQYRKAMWKENDKKFAYVFMSKDFEFVAPNVLPTDDEEIELQKVKEQQEKISVNDKFVNRDRKKIGEMMGV
ncbi:putative 39S ribosomal protein L23 mitochondrial [Trichostrongylus colubriformis]